MLRYYSILRHVHHIYFKTLALHFLELAASNAFVLMCEYCKAHPGAIPSSKSYSFLDFMANLIRPLRHLPTHGDRPPARHAYLRVSDTPPRATHLPGVADVRRNCRVCYATRRVETKTRSTKTRVFCSLCKKYGSPVLWWLQGDRNCYERCHSAEYGGRGQVCSFLSHFLLFLLLLFLSV